MTTIRFFFFIVLCLCFQFTKAQQFSFDVKDQFTNRQFKVDINTSTKTISANGNEGSIFSHKYYVAEVADGTIGFALKQGGKPTFSFDDSNLCFIIHDNDITYINPTTEKAFSFTPLNTSTFASTYNALASRLNRNFTVNGVSFTMVYVEGGKFQMGENDDKYKYSDNRPEHTVTLSSFCIGQTEVTQELWQAVMGRNPSNHKGEKRPVEQVTWSDCQKFITRLNSLTDQNFRFPTEAEWEFAARGGNYSHGYKYAGSNNLDDVAWYDENSKGRFTSNVATKAPNELGIYDMSGNVMEYCNDLYGHYSSESQTNPKGPVKGSSHIQRGGNYSTREGGCIVTIRFSSSPYDIGIADGLRLAL